MHTIPTNFKYPVFKETDYIFGSGQISAIPLRQNGDWRDFLPPTEEQRRHGVESSACFLEAQQHTIATILEEQFGVKDSNFSARFNIQFCNASEDGGDPLSAGDSFRHDGLIPDEMLPFSDDIASWKEFASFKNGNEIECVKAGQAWLSQWTPKYDVVFKREDSIEEKYRKLGEALKYSPVPMSVSQGYSNGQEKPKGLNDIHLVECVFLDEDKCPYILDTYQPFIKKLAPMYNSDFGMRWSITRNMGVKKNWLEDIFYNIMRAEKDIFNNIFKRQ